MALKTEIDARRAEIHSDGYAMSIGELINLYQDGELDVHPEFQRFFRWTIEQKSRLIESILLGIPIPSIFVSQREDAVWDVIDGLQRLSTIFQLVGVLRDEEDQLVEPLTLSRTKYLPSLEGLTWNGDEGNSIGLENQRIIKRSKIDIKIILRESSESSKYELFQRLNTGGSPLSDQELRNVILITVNKDAYDWFLELADDPNFRECTPLSDNQYQRQYDVELVIRFVVLRELDGLGLKSVGDISEFLTDKSVEVADPRTFGMVRAKEEAAFRFTFSELARQLGDKSFRRFNPNRNTHSGPFLLSGFEALAAGLGYNYEAYAKSERVPGLTDIARSVWQNPQFMKNSGSGVRASTRIASIIPLGRELFKP